MCGQFCLKGLAFPSTKGAFPSTKALRTRVRSRRTFMTIKSRSDGDTEPSAESPVRAEFERDILAVWPGLGDTASASISAVTNMSPRREGSCEETTTPTVSLVRRWVNVFPPKRGAECP